MTKNDRSVDDGGRILKDPFDPGNPFDAVTETFRIAVGNSVLAAMKTTIYRELDPKDQIGSIIIGTLVGLVGATFAHLHNEKEGRDYIMAYIAECLPIAREYAEAIIELRSSNE